MAHGVAIVRSEKQSFCGRALCMMTMTMTMMLIIKSVIRRPRMFANAKLSRSNLASNRKSVRRIMTSSDSSMAS